MLKHKAKESGFGAIEVLLLIVALTLIVGVGFYVSSMDSDTSQDAVSPPQAATTSETKQTESGELKKTDNELIEEAAKKECESTNGNNARNINISKLKGDYSSATLECDGKTIRFYLKKSNENWSVVYKGGGAPTTTEDLSPFGFPDDFLN